jgi:hypothetical protein
MFRSHLSGFFRSIYLLIGLALLFISSIAIAQQKVDSLNIPVFRDYKGISLGMPVGQARKKLGAPQYKGEKLESYTISENEIVSIFYDDQDKIIALTIDYINTIKAPAPKAVLGRDITPKADGSMSEMIRYPKAGYWVSYLRTAGDEPMITITMQGYK